MAEDYDMTKPTWTEVVKALEAAKEGSRELDAMIALAIGWALEPRGIGRCWMSPTNILHYEPTRFSRSLDAGRAVIREELPGWDVSSAFTQGVGRAIVWKLSPISRGSFPPKYTTAPTEELAQALAFARAKKAAQ
jgi:hypothetical protein